MANVIEFSLKARDRFSKPLNKVGESLRKVGRVAAIGIGVATTALAALTISSFRSADALAKTSDKLGIATEKLAGLRLAAELTGVETRQLDLGIQRMTRRISEAAQGTGEAVKALDELGLNAKQLAAQPIDEQFKTIAAAMENVTSQSDRVRLGFKLFDAEGVALINTLKLGRQGLEDVEERAKRLGTAITRIDAAKIEQANDAVLLLREGFKGVGTQIAIKLAPFLKVLADRFTNLIEETGGFQDIIIGTFEKAIKGVAFVADAFNGLKIVFLAIKLAFAEYINFVIQGSAQIASAVVAPLNALAETKLGERLGLEILRPMEEIATVASFRIQEIRDELDAAIIKPIPSDAIEAFAEEVIRVSEETSAKIAKVQTDSLGGGPEGGGSVLTKAMKADMAGRLQALQEGLLNERETIILDFENKKADLEEFRAANVIPTELEFTELMKQILAERNIALFDLEAEAENKKFALRKKANAAQFKLVGDASKKNVAAFGAAEQAIFGQNKAAAVVNTGISIIRGIAKAQELPFPANLGEMARIATLGATLVNKLKGKSLSGGAQEGLENVPRTGTFLLHRGERVLSEPQNRELINSIRSATGGGSNRNVTIENIDIVVLPNATNATALLEMDENEMREVVAGPIITALDQLEDQGVRPKSIDRARG